MAGKEGKEYYGKHRAICKDVHDPEQLGRIRVQCPSIFGAALSEWAWPNVPPGMLVIPEEGECVWIEFEDGDIRYPIWTGVLVS